MCGYERDVTEDVYECKTEAEKDALGSMGEIEIVAPQVDVSSCIQGKVLAH